jgi:two-component system, NtrC family, response regulator AtoC
MPENLLIIEDEKLLALEIQRRLSRRGWAVHLAADLAEARRLLVQNRIGPLVVVADMQLPDGNALDLLDELRDGPAAIGKWVFISAYGSPADSKRALQLGAHDFLEKPYEESDLDLAVNEAARTARAQRGSLH